VGWGQIQEQKSGASVQNTSGEKREIKKIDPTEAESWVKRKSEGIKKTSLEQSPFCPVVQQREKDVRGGRTVQSVLLKRQLCKIEKKGGRRNGRLWLGRREKGVTQRHGEKM